MSNNIHMKDSFYDHKKAQHLVQKLSFWWLPPSPPPSTNFNSKTEEFCATMWQVSPKGNTEPDLWLLGCWSLACNSNEANGVGEKRKSISE